MKSRLATATLAAVVLLAAGAAARAADSTKPRIAVLEFKNKADNQWWYSGGAEAAQDVFVTELVKSGKFRVVEREQLDALMAEKNLTLDGDVDPATAVSAGKLLGVQVLPDRRGDRVRRAPRPAPTARVRRLPGFSGGKKTFAAAMNARIIDTRPARSSGRTRRAARTPTSSSRSAASAAASTTTRGCSTR